MIDTQNTKTVEVLSEPRIYKEENAMQKIVQCVLRCVTKLGLRKIFDEDLLYPIATFIFDNYPTYRVKEIDLAFDMAINEKIDVDLSLYGEEFSVKMVGKVLSKYRPFHNSLISDHKTDSIQFTGDIINKNKEVRLKWIDKILKLKELTRLPDFKIEDHHLLHRYYALLQAAGLLNFSNEEKIQIFEKARALKTSKQFKFKESVNQFKQKDLNAKIKEIAKSGSPAKTLAMKLAAVKYLKETKSTDEDIREILTKFIETGQDF